MRTVVYKGGCPVDKLWRSLFLNSNRKRKKNRTMSFYQVRLRLEEFHLDEYNAIDRLNPVAFGVVCEAINSFQIALIYMPS